MSKHYIKHSTNVDWVEWYHFWVQIGLRLSFLPTIKLEYFILFSNYTEKLINANFVINERLSRDLLI